MDYSQILLRPLISEKSTFAKELSNQVVFFVHPSANKVQIKEAVEKAFKVKVDAVNVIKHRAMDRRRMGRVTGKVAGYKKAYVSLAPGEKIEFFEGV